MTVKGGYWEGTSTEEGNWDEASPRDAARYMTVLSAVSEATGTRQEVNGYHAVQFGTEATAALEKPAVLDGVYLEDGPGGAEPLCQRMPMCATVWCVTIRLRKVAGCSFCPVDGFPDAV